MKPSIVELLAEQRGQAAWQLAKQAKPAEWFFARIAPVAVPKHFTFTTAMVQSRVILVRMEWADPHALGYDFLLDLEQEDTFNGDLFAHEIDRAAYRIGVSQSIHCRIILRSNYETVEEMRRQGTWR